MAHFCEHCGTPLHMTDKFCPGCGQPVIYESARTSGTGAGAAGAAAAGAGAAAGSADHREWDAYRDHKTGYQSAGGQKDWDEFRSAKTGTAQTQNYYQPELGREMGIGNWIVTLIITVIPVVGFIMLIVWAVGGSPKFPARRNWAIAQFIIMAVFIALGIIFSAVAGVALTSAFGSAGLS